MKITSSGQNPLIIRLAGKLNEGGELDLMITPTAENIEVDLSELTMINSVGIRSFKSWASKLTAPKLTFTFCPRFFIDQVNMIDGFIPAHAKIDSFYVPFYNEDSDQEKLVLYTRGQQYSSAGGQFRVDHAIVKDSNGGDMDLDATDRDFQFLNNH